MPTCSHFRQACSGIKNSCASKAGKKIPGRAAAILAIVRNRVREAGAADWAEQPVRLPWEMTFRSGIARAAIVAVVVLASLLGALVCWAAGHGPESLLRIVNAWLQTADQIGGRVQSGSDTHQLALSFLLGLRAADATSSPERSTLMSDRSRAAISLGAPRGVAEPGGLRGRGCRCERLCRSSHRSGGAQRP